MKTVEIIILTIQVLVLLFLIFTSVICLIFRVGDSNLWVTILAGSVGILVPQPYVLQQITL